MLTNHSRSKWRWVVAVSAALALALSACSSSTNDSGGTTSPRAATNSLVAIASQDPGTLDYVKSTLTALRLWIPNIVEPLLYFGEDGKPSGAVADKWEVSDDQRTYTFHIRDAKFSTGDPVTADDVVFSLKTMQKSPVADYSSAYAHVTEIAKVDDHTVRVKLDKPSQTFYRGMGGMAGLIQPEADAGKRATKPIGTGPYELVEYVSNDHWKLKANPSYWGPQPKIKDVTVRIITDGTAALNAIKAGEGDLFTPITPDLWERITKDKLDKKLNLKTYPQVGEPLYVVVNSKFDLGLRQVIAKTLKRETYIDAYNAPWGMEATCTFALPNRAWYAPASASSCPYQYDPKAAASEVAAKGYGSKELNFVGISDVPELTRPLVIAGVQAAGLKVKQTSPDLARYSQTVFSGDPPQFDVTVMAGPDNLEQWACSDPDKASWSTYCSQEYTDLLAKADAAQSDDEYTQYMSQAEKILQKDAVIIPMLVKKGVGLFAKDLQGFAEPRVLVEVRLASFHW